MKKHSTGPWVAECGSARIVQKSTGNVIATLVDDYGNPLGGYHLNENARLIAASPELLSALTEVVAVIEAYCNDRARNNPMPRLLTAVTVCLPRLQAAISLTKEN